jgi:hypothetical protein
LIPLVHHFPIDFHGVAPNGINLAQGNIYRTFLVCECRNIMKADVLFPPVQVSVFKTPSS